MGRCREQAVRARLEANGSSKGGHLAKGLRPDLVFAIFPGHDPVDDGGDTQPSTFLALGCSRGLRPEGQRKGCPRAAAWAGPRAMAVACVRVGRSDEKWG